MSENHVGITVQVPVRREILAVIPWRKMEHRWFGINQHGICSVEQDTGKVTTHTALIGNLTHPWEYCVNCVCVVLKVRVVVSIVNVFNRRLHMHGYSIDPPTTGALHSSVL